jgi:hypothetical protein
LVGWLVGLFVRSFGCLFVLFGCMLLVCVFVCACLFVSLCLCVCLFLFVLVCFSFVCLID